MKNKKNQKKSSSQDTQLSTSSKNSRTKTPRPEKVKYRHMNHWLEDTDEDLDPDFLFKDYRNDDSESEE